jgi:hypothetical protein
VFLLLIIYFAFNSLLGYKYTMFQRNLYYFAKHIYIFLLIEPELKKSNYKKFKTLNSTLKLSIHYELIKIDIPLQKIFFSQKIQ